MASITIKVVRNGGNSTRDRGRRLRRVLMAVSAVVAAVVGGLVATAGVASASIVSIPPQTIANNVTLPGGGYLKLVSSGGSTTVPTDATRVVFGLTITNATANGNITAFATGSSGSGNVHYLAGSTTNGTLTEPIGLSNQVTFHNTGSNGISLTVQVTGYSTEVRATDVSGTGGSAGQVLTNTGTGAAWKTVSNTYTGFGDGIVAQGLNWVETASVTVPAGTYVVTGRTVPHNFDSTNQPTRCDIKSSNGQDVDDSYMGVDASADSEIVNLATITIATSGTTVDIECITNAASMYYQRSRIVATLVGSVTSSGAARSRHAVHNGGVSTAH